MLTVDQLYQIIKYPQIGEYQLRARCELWLLPLLASMAEFKINTPLRVAMFIAQLAHESGRFVYTREIWGPTKAQAGYDARADLGNTNPLAIEIAASHNSTPGRWWAGHGPIQITGFDNHRVCGDALGLDLLNFPMLLEDPVHGCMAAAWWWHENCLNAVADTGNIDHVSDEVNRGRITQKVGDANGYADRKELAVRAMKALGVVL